MSHLTKIEIENFKSYEKIVIDLTEGINVIYGDPQAGKSNIFRALDLLMSNRPRGGKFMPNFTTKCETHVAITDSDGKRIGIKCRVHTTKKNAKKRDSTYYYIEDTKNEKYWDASGVGSEVPAEITDALNLTNINLQFQKDEPFLATKSGSKISKTINKITGLDIGDRLSSNLSTQINTQNAIVKSIADELRGFKETKKFFTNITSLKKTINEVKALEIKISKTDGNLTQVKSRTERVVRLEEMVAEFKIPDIGGQMKEVGKLNRSIREGEDKLTSIQNMVNRIKNLTFEVDHVESTFPDDYQDKVKEVQQCIDSIKNAESVIRACKHALTLKNNQGLARYALDGAIKSYIDIIKDAASCPMCFQKIDQKTLKNIERRIHGR
jgi:chromosome segregation ATPase